MSTDMTNTVTFGQQDLMASISGPVKQYLSSGRQKRWLARLAILNANTTPGEAASIEMLHEWYHRYQKADLNGMLIDQEVLADVERDRIDEDWYVAEVNDCSTRTIVWKGLCNYCIVLLQRWPNIVSDEQSLITDGYYSTSVQIDVATAMGCNLCALLSSRLYSSEVWPTFKKIEYRLHRLGVEPRHIDLSILTWDRQTAESQLIWMNFPGKNIMNRNAGCAMSTMFESCVLPAGSKRFTRANRYDLTKRWMSQCDQQHEHCCTSATRTHFRPSRLLRILEDKIKVESTRQWHDVPAYATLSYCWGPHEFLMLTKTTSDRLSQGVRCDTLPNAFQNAITVTRHLRLDYIWIDALCIMQGAGNTEDWLAELALMKDIYSGADINIAFTSAKHVFQDSLNMARDYSGGFATAITYSDCCRKQGFHPSSPYEEAITEQHLATRAWTFQERLLARRTVSIGETGWFWECRAQVASEYLPDGYPDIKYPRLSKPLHEAWEWSDIVNIYSQANMTKPSDKLPALSGIARAQHDIVRNTYLAGMWETDLIAQLGWICNEPTLRPPHRAPSWSWTSINGQIEYWSNSSIAPIAQHYAEVREASIELAGTDPFGPVLGGRLLLSCKVFSARLKTLCELTQKEWKTGTVLLQADQAEYFVLLDCAHGDELRIDEEVILVPLHGFEEVIELDDRQGTDFEAIEDARLVRGLVLRPLSSDGSVYRRIGAFKFSSLVSMYEDHPRTAEFYRNFVMVMQGLKQDGSAQEILPLPERCIGPEQLIAIV